MERTLEELVWERAHSRCEYCQMPQEYDGFTHEIDHVIAKKHEGPTAAFNLALACFPCNNHKGTDLAGIDKLTKKACQALQPSTTQVGAALPLGRTLPGGTHCYRPRDHRRLGH